MPGSHQLCPRARHLRLGFADACLPWGATPAPRGVFSPTAPAAELFWLRPCHGLAASWGPLPATADPCPDSREGRSLILGGCWAVLCPPRCCRPASHPGVRGRPGSGHQASEGHLGLSVTCSQVQAPPWDRPFPPHPPTRPVLPTTTLFWDGAGILLGGSLPAVGHSEHPPCIPAGPETPFRPRVCLQGQERPLRDLVQGLQTLQSRSSSKNLDVHHVKEVKAGVEGKARLKVGEVPREFWI